MNREFFVSVTFYQEDEENNRRITGIRGDISFTWDETNIFYANMKKAIHMTFEKYVDLEKFYFHVDAICEITKTKNEKL